MGTIEGATMVMVMVDIIAVTEEAIMEIETAIMMDMVVMIGIIDIQAIMMDTQV